jgi:hypothetical protein
MVFSAFWTSQIAMKSTKSVILRESIRLGLLLLASLASAAPPLLPAEWEVKTAKSEALPVRGGSAILALEDGNDTPGRSLVLRDARSRKVLWSSSLPVGVDWQSMRAGRELVALTGLSGHAPPVGRVYRLLDGSFVWQRHLGWQYRLTIGEDGTGVASKADCSLIPHLARNGNTRHHFKGDSDMVVGYVSESGTDMHSLCTSRPRLIGQTEDLSFVLHFGGRHTGRGGGGLVLTASGGPEQGWSLPLGPAVTDLGVDLERGLVWYSVTDSTKGPHLVVQRLRLADGKVLWRRDLAEAEPSFARVVEDPDRLLLQAGSRVRLVAPKSGKDLCSTDVGKAIAVVVGEKRSPPELPFGDSGVARDFAWIDHACQLVGKGRVDPGIRPLFHRDGFVLFRRREWAALQGRDGRERWRRPTKSTWVSLLEGLVIVPLGYPQGLQVIDGSSGAIFGQTKVSGQPLAVVPATKDKPRLLIYLAGYLFAVRLP